MSTGRKVFHCAVDETALTTNVSEIKKWTTNGAITLMVPLYTLERLHGLKRTSSQIAINAREAVRFLDRVTSGKDSIASEHVLLQGPMEQYEHWEEAEKFFLPEFEEEPEAIDGATTDGPEQPAMPEKGEQKAKKNDSAPDDLSQMLLSKLNFKKDADAVSLPSTGTHSGPASRASSRSSQTSPDCANSHMAEVDGEKAKPTAGHQRTASGSAIPTVPAVLRPLLSALLWRLHSGPDASNASKNCILITNDRTTQVWAQKFGIAVKNIHQLRTSIQYEEREYKNRCKYVEKTQATGTEPKSLLSYEDESDEDELVFVPRGRGKGASRGGSSRGASNRKGGAASKTSATPTENAVEIPTQPIDPNSFSRSLNSPAKQQSTAGASTPTGGGARGTSGSSSSRHHAGRRGGSRGNSSRGGGSGRGRGKLWVP